MTFVTIKNAVGTRAPVMINLTYTGWGTRAHTRSPTARFQGRCPFQLYDGPEDRQWPTKALAKRLYGIINTVIPPSQKHKYILESDQEDGLKSGLLTEDKAYIHMEASRNYLIKPYQFKTTLLE